MEKVTFIGPSFATNNLGVNALALGTIQSIIVQGEDVEIVLIDYNKKHEIGYDVDILGKTYQLNQYNMRFSKQFFHKYHIVKLILTSLLLKLIPGLTLKNKIISRNNILKELWASRVVCSIAGGDSFSDIYGYKRFAYIVLPQILTILLNKKLVLLPQTLGPFKSKISQITSRYIIKNASIVYSRDQQGLEDSKKILQNKYRSDKFKFCYDVGFAIQSHEMQNEDTEYLSDLTKNNSLTGFNISGLLYIGGYTKKNMFGLHEDYQQLVKEIIKYLITVKKSKIVFIPHVLGEGHNIESDESAINLIYDEMSGTYPDDIIRLRHKYNQNQIKHIIKMCDLFLGSRMHSCIAAASQCIPPVSLAYSKKFVGVMQSVGLEGLVADLRVLSIPQVLEIINRAFDNRVEIESELNHTMPEVYQHIKNEFKSIVTL